jgi:hypothetical protein
VRLEGENVRYAALCIARFDSLPGAKILQFSKASRRDFWPSLPPTKGVSEAASLGIMAAVVMSEQLKRHPMLILRTSGNMLPLPHISVHKFPENQGSI